MRLAPRGRPAALDRASAGPHRLWRLRGGGGDRPAQATNSHRQRRSARPRRGPRAVAEDVESLCTGRIAGASSIDRARGQGDALAEDFALELLDDDRPPLDGVDFYRVGGSTVVLNADARWKICAQCRDAVQRGCMSLALSTSMRTPAGATTLGSRTLTTIASSSRSCRARSCGESSLMVSSFDLGAELTRPADAQLFLRHAVRWRRPVSTPWRAHVCQALDGEPSIHVSIGLDLDPTLTWVSALQTFVSKAR